MKKHLLAIFALIAFVVACTTQPSDVAIAPTATFLPIPSQLPRFTATLQASRTPLPTFTYTPTNTPVPPTPTLSQTPTLTPTVVGIVQSLQRVNVRQGPGEEYGGITSLPPGTGVQVIGQDTEGSWFNVRLDDGREGWVSGRLLFLPPSATPLPSATPSPDLTALFGGTPLPTAFLGGGTVTPTPPSLVATATGVGERPSATPVTPTQPIVPIVNLDTINLTATALAGGAATETPSRTPTITPTTDRVLAVETSTSLPADFTPSPTPLSQSSGLTDAQAVSQDGIDVFAFCDERQFGIPAPTNVRAGQSIEIWWAWFAREEGQVRSHIDNATYDIRVNGQSVTAVINDYRRPIRKQGTDFVSYWYVPFGPLDAGDYEITFVVSWTQAITDGYESFGPGTAKTFEQHSCRLTVR